MMLPGRILGFIEFFHAPGRAQMAPPGRILGFIEVFPCHRPRSDSASGQNFGIHRNFSMPKPRSDGTTWARKNDKCKIMHKEEQRKTP
jgi:hypothetical protein